MIHMMYSFIGTLFYYYNYCNIYAFLLLSQSTYWCMLLFPVFAFLWEQYLQMYWFQHIALCCSVKPEVLQSKDKVSKKKVSANDAHPYSPLPCSSLWAAHIILLQQKEQQIQSKDSVKVNPSTWLTAEMLIEGHDPFSAIAQISHIHRFNMVVFVRPIMSLL